MINPPEHPLGHAFQKAREWQAEQERQLTSEQRRAFDEIKHRQALERRRQQERIDAVRTLLQDKAKARKPKAEKNFNPPHLIADPYIRRHARFIVAAEKRLERLDRSHADARAKMLKKFEQEREQQKTRPAKELSASWNEALRKTAAQERDREGAKDLHRDIDRSN